MKRIVSIITCMVLLASLFSACTEETAPDNTVSPSGNAGVSDPVTESEPPDTGPTTEELEASLPFEYVPQKLEAGMEVIVAGIMQNLQDQMIVDTQEGLKAALTEVGINYMYTSYDLDTSVQLSQIENYLTMGAACITTALSDVSLCTQYSEMCEAVGCYFTVNGSLPTTYISGASATDQEYIGELIATMAISWLDQRYPDAGPGSIKVCQLGNIRNPEPTLHTEKAYETISADPRCEVVYKNDAAMGIDLAFTAAQEAVTANPDIRLFICFNFSQATGVNNLVMSLPNIDPGDYAVFGFSYDDTTIALIEASKNNESIFRGAVISAAKTSYQAMYDVITGLLIEGKETPYIVQEPLATINGIGWELP